ncbi:MAG: hypothetical protein HFH38_08685 [Lachnospiraceae bacterium]|jgi:hypothetical protein|nr:hypothetical protein [Lachnospiraceae bacterium]
MGKLVIDGNSVYEIDEECVRRKGLQESQPGTQKLPERAYRGTDRNGRRPQRPVNY